MNSRKNKSKKKVEKRDSKPESPNKRVLLVDDIQVKCLEKLIIEPVPLKDFDENIQIIGASTNSEEEVTISKHVDFQSIYVSNSEIEPNNLEGDIQQPSTNENIEEELITQNLESENANEIHVINVNEEQKFNHEFNSTIDLDKKDNDEKIDEIKLSLVSEQKDKICLDTVQEKNYVKMTEEFSSEKSQLDKDSFSSRPNSIKEFFSSSRQDNAKRIQSQIVDLQTNALYYSNSLINLSKDFIRMKKNFKSKTNIIFNYLDSLFGYSYRSNFENSNFFIFATQSLLIILGEILDSKFKNFSDQEKLNFKYYNLLEIISTEMRQVTAGMEEAFLNNLGIFTRNRLINTTNFSKTNLIENNIGSIFLKSISDSIKILVDINTKTDIERKEFEEIFKNIFQNSFEKILDVEFLQEEKESICFSQFWDDFQVEKLIESNNRRDMKNKFDSYLQDLINSEKFKEKNISVARLSDFKMFAEAFYIFSQTSIDEIILDANVYIKNYSSIVYKMKRFIDQSMSECTNISQKAKFFFEKVYRIKLNPLQLERISVYINYININIAKKCAVALKRGSRNVYEVKNWLNDSYRNLRKYKPFFIISNLTSDMIKYTLEVPEVFYEIIVEKFNYGHEKYKELKNKLYKIICSANELIRKKLFTNFKRYIYLKEDEVDERIVIVLNRRLMNLCPVMLCGIFDNIRNFISNSNEITNSFKQSILSKYKRLLNIDDRLDADKNECVTNRNLASSMSKKGSCVSGKILFE